MDICAYETGLNFITFIIYSCLSYPQYDLIIIKPIWFNLDVSLFFVDFSMTDWLDNMGIPSLEDLKDSAKAMLIQQLGMNNFLLDAPCKTSDALYSPSVNGWKNGKG